MRALQSVGPVILAALTFLAGIAVAWETTGVQMHDSTVAAAPTLVSGDAWIFRYSNGIRGMRKFLKEESGVLVFEAAQTWQDGSTSQGILHLTRDLAIVRMLGADGTEHQRFDPHSLGLQFPLAVGKQWQARCRRFDEGKLAGEFVGAYTVVGVQEVTAPAGKFRALRVEGETQEAQTPARRWRFTYWYAPEVRTEVRFRAIEPDGSGTEYELVEFRQAGVSRPPVPSGLEAFLGVWEGHWKEMVLATKLTVERIVGDTASVVYWRGAYLFPGLQRPTQQRVEGRFLDERTLKLEVWDDASARWADATYTLNNDGTLTGTWRSGGVVATATLTKEP